MAFMIAITVFAMLILLLGLAEIKIPFISVKEEQPVKKVSAAFKQKVKISEKLVKNSIEETILRTKILKDIVKENALTGNE
ncbi:MAG: hypothetical protein QM737_11380 [Ferruginibacter sp.]